MGWSGEREKFLLNLIHKAGIVGFTFHIVYMVAYCDGNQVSLCSCPLSVSSMLFFISVAIKCVLF